MKETVQQQEVTKRFSKERFKKVMGRNPLTWHEGATITMFMGTGFVCGAGFVGYLETLKAVADGSDLAKPLIEGVAATIGGIAIGGALGVGEIAARRGWGNAEEPVPDSRETEITSFRDFMKINRGWFLRNGVGYGLSFSAMAASGVATAAGNEELANYLMLGGMMGSVTTTALSSVSTVRFKKNIS